MATAKRRKPAPRRTPAPRRKPAAARASADASTNRSGTPTPGAAAALARVRKLCLGFPEVSERPSHGAPTFFIRNKKTFLNFVDNHHGDGKLAVIVAAPPGFQGTIVQHDPVTYYLPAYVARLGWVGVRLDQGTAWNEIAGVIEQAYVTVAPPELAARLRGG